MDTDFRRDGSFFDQSLEAEFRAHIWPRDCQQLRAIAIPIALALVAPLPLNGMALGWSNPLFYGDILIRTVAVALCLATYLVFESAPKSQRTLVLPFATTLSANVAVLFAIVSGANGVEIVTSAVVIVTFCNWSFVPLKVRDLLLSCSSIFLGYIAILLLTSLDNLQSAAFASIFLIMINTIGFFHVRNRNISDRNEVIVSRELLATTETLRQEIAVRIEAEKMPAPRKKFSTECSHLAPFLFV